MKVNYILSTNFGGSERCVTINPLYNKTHPFLYNEINDLTKSYQIPATFKTDKIELTSVSKSVLRRLNELKIRFKSK